MKLTFLMEYHADLKEPQTVGATPFGNRAIYDITGGSFEGPGLRGIVLPSGGDWLLVDDSGIGRLDVRATFQTDDNAYIYMQYFGIVIPQGDALTAASSATQSETQYGDIYFMTQPRFETSAEPYMWLNSTVAVAQGRTLPNAVEYKVFAVEND